MITNNSVMQNKLILIDIDDTLYDVQRNKTIQPTTTIVRSLMESHPILFITYRPEAIRNETLQWLKDHVEDTIDNSQLLMRPNYVDAFNMPPPQMKLYQAMELSPDLSDILMIIDDSPETCEAFQKHGVQALCPFVNED
jgi:hypothetical protein